MSRRPVICVVDYGMGNRRSVQRALAHVGAEVQVTGAVARLRAADGLVVPGVGAFPEGMARLLALGLHDELRRAAAAGTPLLGICLGMQLLFERSTEHEPTAGLALLAGEVSPLRAEELRVPHIGWSDVALERASPLTAALPAGGCPFYHVHSLVARPREPRDVVGITDYGERFASIVARGNVFGVQFHPEKSSRHGLALLGSFVSLCAVAGPGATGGRPAATGTGPAALAGASSR
ncbi:MAG: imidazole glycerol phosphate synthase subunit HisH [Solirubrobacteraceae bacterium]